MQFVTAELSTVSMFKEKAFSHKFYPWHCWSMNRYIQGFLYSDSMQAVGILYVGPLCV